MSFCHASKPTSQDKGLKCQQGGAGQFRDEMMLWFSTTKDPATASVNFSAQIRNPGLLHKLLRPGFL